LLLLHQFLNRSLLVGLVIKMMDHKRDGECVCTIYSIMQYYPTIPFRKRPPGKKPMSNRQENAPLRRVVGFADGHSELHKWRSNMFTSAAEFSGSFNMGIGEYNYELWLQ
jgi:hypothetical protein